MISVIPSSQLPSPLSSVNRFTPRHVPAATVRKGGVAGPASADLPRPPADMQAHLPHHNDSMSFGLIRDGISASGMRGQAANLTEDEMWHLVNYLRAAFEGG